MVTPSLDCGILASTTREWVITSGAPELGLAVRQEHVLHDDLFAADEAFVASSVAGIVPVTRVDGRPIGSGAPGARTMHLRALARERGSRYAVVGVRRKRLFVVAV